MLFLLISLSASGQTVDVWEGEHLKYNAKYGIIKGGEVVINSKRVRYQNDDCYNVKIDMYAIGLVDDIFHFHDIFESYFSTKTMMPYLFVRDAHEGKYTAFEKVFYHDTYIESTLKGRFETGKRYYDLVSSIFALRRMDWSRLKEGDEIIFPIYFDEKIFDVKIIYTGKVDLKMNRKIYHCRQFTPVFTGTGMFSKNGVNICFSDDYKRKPVLIKVNFKVGSFKVELVE
ncbi:MAG: DUF3108 domain-containing protein [Prevotellaceae bacterium]|jgi:hypothetical protein|nr:DUF3108 domain-containing protein [Prevotellaceae bacterium]